MLLADMHPSKAPYFISFTPSGITILSSELHPKKASDSILVIPFGILILLSHKHPENALLPIPVTFSQF